MKIYKCIETENNKEANLFSDKMMRMDVFEIDGEPVSIVGYRLTDGKNPMFILGKPPIKAENKS